MTASAIVPSPFDAEAFERPFFRVQRVDETLPGLVQQLRETHHSLMIDAKTPASDVEAARVLWSAGFRKVCMQMTLVHALDPVPPPEAGPVLTTRLLLPDDVRARHADNFSRDRFSLDPLIPREGIRRLYGAWIRNSLERGQKDVVHVGVNFCTLACSGGTAKIDLLSVLEPGRGIGRQLVTAACHRAHELGAERLLVTTECENARAWRLYQRCGFVPCEFVAVFHAVHGR